MAASFEQIAWQMYAQLNSDARKAVDSWRSLGNDLTTSLLNSGALGGRRHPAGDPDDWNRRRLNPDDVELQNTCEHEAAHAVVAHVLGLGPVEAVVDEGGRSGVTNFQSTSRLASAIVAAAAEVWITEFRYNAFPACMQRDFSHDLQVLVRNTDSAMGVHDARRRARVILTEHREEVLAAAHRLAQDRRLLLD
ncbi:hypothetical protein [Kitasatospora sp. NPDC007106]|uniref:hypothetical protein n=1 Tax=Kitasatospora sp. NPDC007106 TaxID=3156914 RepID=UPI0033C64F47